MRVTKIKMQQSSDTTNIYYQCGENNTIRMTIEGVQAFNIRRVCGIKGISFLYECVGVNNRGMDTSCAFLIKETIDRANEVSTNEMYLYNEMTNTFDNYLVWQESLYHRRFTGLESVNILAKSNPPESVFVHMKGSIKPSHCY